MSLNNKSLSHIEENNFLVQEAINEGIELAEKTDESNQHIIINFTRSELQKMQDLISSLNLSQATLLESAIQYVYFRFNSDQENITKVIEYDSQRYNIELEQIKSEKLSRKDSDKFSTKIKLSDPIADKVKKIDMIDKINECIFTGVNLLYQQLIENFKLVPKQK
jgi:hypothetical protein